MWFGVWCVWYAVGVSSDDVQVGVAAGVAAASDPEPEVDVVAEPAVDDAAVRSVIRPQDTSQVDAVVSDVALSPGGGEGTAPHPSEPSAPPATKQIADAPDATPVTTLRELRDPSPAPVVDVSSLTVEQQAKMWRDTVASGGSLRAKQ